jgi:large subunit ribosomal protein L25
VSETITAVTRTEFGKGAARRARRAGTIPAVLYGPGLTPVHLALPAHETFLQIKGKANPVLTVAFEGRTELTLVKDVQRDPVRQVIEHLDLILVRKGELVTVDVPVAVTGEPEPGWVLNQELASVAVLADPSAIPAHLEVPLAPIEGSAVVTAGDLALPSGVRLVTEPDAVVLTVAAHGPEATED